MAMPSIADASHKKSRSLYKRVTDSVKLVKASAYLPASSWKFPKILSCLPLDFCWVLPSDVDKVFANFKDADRLILLVVNSKEDILFAEVELGLGVSVGLVSVFGPRLLITVLAMELPPIAPGDLNVTCL